MNKFFRFPEEEPAHWLEIIADDTGFIFPSKITGGHELMAIEIINVALSGGRRVRCYVDKENESLFLMLNKISEGCDLLKVSTISYSQPRLEIIRELFDIFLKRNVRLFSEVVASHKLQKVIIVQGDIEVGSILISYLRGMNINAISYIPYLHGSKLMGKRFPILRDYLIKRFIKMNSMYLTISDSTKMSLLRINNDCKVDIIRNRVKDLSRYKNKRNENSGSDISKFEISIIGRVDFKQKGHDILFEALVKLPKKAIDNIRLNIIGDGKDKNILINNLKCKIPELEFFYKSWTSEPWEFCFNSDLIVIPSRFEGVPLVMLEALDMNIPVIATKRDGMVEYLEEDMLFTDDVELSVMLNSRLEEYNKKRD